MRWAMRGNKTTGFTIVELLIVIVVIAILATITVVAYNGIQQRAKNSATVATIDSWEKALRMAATHGYAIPTTALCLGRPGDFPAEGEFLENQCFVMSEGGVTQAAFSYSEGAFSTWDDSQLKRPSGETPIVRHTSEGVTYSARGIWVAAPRPGGISIRWLNSVGDACARGRVVTSGVSDRMCAQDIIY